MHVFVDGAMVQVSLHPDSFTEKTGRLTDFGEAAGDERLPTPGQQP